MSRYGQAKSGGRFGTAGASNVTKLLQKMSMQCAEEKKALDKEHQELFGAPSVMYKRRVPVSQQQPQASKVKSKINTGTTGASNTNKNNAKKATTETYFAHATNVGERPAPIYSRQDFEDAGLIPPGADDISFANDCEDVWRLHEAEIVKFESDPPELITLKKIPFPPTNNDVMKFYKRLQNNDSPRKKKDKEARSYQDDFGDLSWKQAYHACCLRWHPDKFCTRHAERIPAGQVDLIRERLNDVLSALTEEWAKYRANVAEVERMVAASNHQGDC